MATAPTDQQRSTLLAIALFAVALTIFGARAIRAGRDIEALSVPATNLEALSSFMSPLTDTSASAPIPGTTATVRHDPFAGPSVPVPRAVSATTDPAPVPATVDGPRWIVS